MVFDREKVEMVNFGNLYMVSIPVDERFEIVLGGERLEVIEEFLRV